MFEAPLSINMTSSRSPTSAYLAELRREIERCADLDLATRELFVAEISQHFEMLYESLEADGRRDEKLESKAVSLMESPAQLVRALRQAEIIAKKSCPHWWQASVLKAWAQFLQLKATVVLAVLVSVACVLTALILGAVIPPAWQEFWIVPVVAAAMFGSTVLASQLLHTKTNRLDKARLVFSGLVFGLGAHLATWCAESVARLDWALAVPAAYSALVFIISLFTATSFSGIFFDDAGSRGRYLMISFTAVLVAFLLLTLLLGLLPGSNHGLLFCLYTFFGIATVFATRRYVCLRTTDELCLETYAR